MNGEIERWNRTIQEMLLKTQLVNEIMKGGPDRTADTHWAKRLEGLLFTYRLKVQASTGYSPFRLMYGQEAILCWEADEVLDVTVPSDEDKDEDSKPGNSIHDVVEQTDKIWQIISGNAQRMIEKSQK